MEIESVVSKSLHQLGVDSGGVGNTEVRMVRRIAEAVARSTWQDHLECNAVHRLSQQIGQLVELMEVARPAVDQHDRLDHLGSAQRFDVDEVHVETFDLRLELREAVDEVDLLLPVEVLAPVLDDLLQVVAVESVLEAVQQRLNVFGSV